MDRADFKFLCRIRCDHSKDLRSEVNRLGSNDCPCTRCHQQDESNEDVMTRLAVRTRAAKAASKIATLPCPGDQPVPKRPYPLVDYTAAFDKVWHLGPVNKLLDAYIPSVIVR